MRKTLRDARDEGRDDGDYGNVDRDAERQTKALAGLALILALAVIGCYLLIHLHALATVEDCLLAQRTDCDSLIDSR